MNIQEHFRLKQENRGLAPRFSCFKLVKIFEQLMSRAKHRLSETRVRDSFQRGSLICPAVFLRRKRQSVSVPVAAQRYTVII